MAEKLTPIFPQGTKPARAGVYLTHKPCKNQYSYWDGSQWSPQKRTRELVPSSRGIKAAYQNKPWQGLTKEPTRG